MNTKIHLKTFLEDQTLAKDRGRKQQRVSQTASSKVSVKDIRNDQELLFIGDSEAQQGGKSAVYQYLKDIQFVCDK